MNFNITIIPATIADYPTIQNMGRFYVYDQAQPKRVILSFVSQAGE
jgi:hypothetical protein